MIKACGGGAKVMGFRLLEKNEQFVKPNLVICLYISVDTNRLRIFTTSTEF
jgi:hypothetical protein